MEIIKAIILGIVEGITEWLPISSTGHMILIDEFLKLNMSEAFKDMFIVVIQLGAIMAVVILYWKRIFPFSLKKKDDFIQKDIMSMWFKIVIACIPAAIVELKWDEEINALFYNFKSVAIVLIAVGMLFILVENYNKHRKASVTNINDITYKMAIIIGICQMMAGVFPGTSRSGATILGALLIGISREVSTEFTFFLAIPVMFGASLFKLIKFGLVFTSMELIVLIVGMIVAFIVSIIVIKLLVSYIQKHDFKIFGWYRIILGCILLVYNFI